MSEIVTLVDEQDNEIGSKKRSKLNDNDRWRIISVWVLNQSDELLIAKRSMNNRMDPGKWGPSVVGTVEHGDIYKETAVRELQEELGVNLKLEESQLIMHKAHIGYRANMCYIAHTQKRLTEFILQAEEVDEIAWINLNKLYEELKRTPEKYMEAMEEITKKVFEA
ncbi:MAG: NUDIX domain-containing protein [Candidatus Saccharibacteria bacterium]|nr:NUDIX domain-containing protein [Candidatus Saccharibacteria bacterium]